MPEYQCRVCSQKSIMSEYPRFQLNRGMIMLRYKQPYVDWAKSAGPSPCDLILEDANHDGEVFLVPSYDSRKNPIDGTEDAVKWVEKRWRMLFEHVLGSWILDETEWPQKRTLKMFHEWFDIEYRSMVWDMGHEPYVIEDFGEEPDEGHQDTDSTLH